MSYLDTHGLNTLWAKLKSTFIGEAPSDSKEYVRKNGAWSEAAGSTDATKSNKGLMQAYQYMTQAEVDAIDEIVDGYTEELVDSAVEGDLYVGGYVNSENSRYSTDEQRIGTWIDGKPLYRKVTLTNTPSSSSWQTVSTGATNIDRVVRREVSLKSGSYTYFADHYENSSSWFLVVQNGDLLSVTVSSSMCNKPMIVILEYTKTTD